MTESISIPNRKRFGRLFYGAAILFLLLRWKSHVLLSQLYQPELIYTGHDYTYILFAWSGFTHFVVNHLLVSLLIDVGLFVTAILGFINPLRSKAPTVFTSLLTIYIIVGYSFLCFHKHNLTGVWFCSLLFLTGSNQSFANAFSLLRLYTLFVYASSGFWKFFRGVWDAKGHLSVILKNDALPFMVQHKGSVHTQLISWLIIHPSLLDQMMVVTCFMQLFFLLGFFTRRLDLAFFLFAVLFHIFSLLLLRAYFIEFSLLLMTLLPWKYLYDKKEIA